MILLPFTPRLLRGLIALSALVVALAPVSAHAQAEQSIVVLVNDQPITNFDVSQRLRFFEVATKKKATAAAREKVIEELIVERIQLQEASKAGIAIDDKEVNEVFSAMAKRNKMTAEQLTKALAQLGVNAKTLRDRSRAAIAWRELVKRKFRNRVTVAAVDVDRALNNDSVGGQDIADGGDSGDDQSGASKGEEKTEFQLYRVYLELPDSSDQKQVMARLADAEKLRDGFRSCKSIAELVGNISRASSRDVGRKHADEIPQPTRALLLSAKEGQMTPPNITASGIELYAVCSRRTVRSDDGERKEVRSKLINEQYQRLANGYLSDLRASAFVERPNQEN